MKAVWNNGSGGDFTDTADWSTGTVPGAASTAAITASGTYTVTSSVNETVLALATAAGATLQINDSTFTVLDGTATGANAGTIEVNAVTGGALVIGGTINNKGTIAVAATVEKPTSGFYGDLLISNLGATLEGGGRVTLTGPYNDVAAVTNTNSAGTTLVNVNDTISGAGAVGYNASLDFSGSLGALYIVNESNGIIDANVVGASLNIFFVTNEGTLEATNGGLLGLKGNVNNIGGLIEANGSGSTVYLNQSVEGGTLNTLNGGAIIASSGAGIDGSTNVVINDGVLTLSSGAAISGTIENNGAIDLNSGGMLVANAWTLTGGGSVTLSNDESNLIGGSSLTNVANTISGAGQIGGPTFTLTNQSKGVIDADGSNPLIIDTGANVITNAGTLEATQGARCPSAVQWPTLALSSPTLAMSSLAVGSPAKVLLRSPAADKLNLARPLQQRSISPGLERLRYST